MLSYLGHDLRSLGLAWLGLGGLVGLIWSDSDGQGRRTEGREGIVDGVVDEWIPFFTFYFLLLLLTKSLFVPNSASVTLSIASQLRVRRFTNGNPYINCVGGGPSLDFVAGL